MAVVVFLGIAFVGLLAIAAAMGPMFLVVKYAGAAYLIWRGYRLIVAKDSVVDVETARRGGLWQDIGLGLLATLSNPKAILFFGALMPTLIDMTAVAAVDFLVLSSIVAGVSFLFYGICVLLAARRVVPFLGQSGPVASQSYRLDLRRLRRCGRDAMAYKSRPPA